MSEAITASPGRVLALDLARTGALFAMAVYHFAFDLEMFGYLAPGTAYDQPLRGLAVATASSFLALAGISHVLAHREGTRWRGFARRLAMVAGAALVISIGSFIWARPVYIYFGILHCIAAMSLLGLLALRLPALALLALAAGAFILPEFVTLSARWLLWTGLVEPLRPALDYVPILPWAAAFLAGMAAGKIGQSTGLWGHLAKQSETPLSRWLALPGRHSLLVYLAHQPILIGLIWVYTQLFT